MMSDYNKDEFNACYWSMYKHYIECCSELAPLDQIREAWEGRENEFIQQWYTIKKNKEESIREY